ncbi:MAG: rRNA cytosine-C5-methylase [Propionibacteriaceae bacterium]|jgi:16S rRNA (cytosine967-C5)-methyltransferase|nr:rRNA cytosine-C5-methylase [Propionibacteriaceae bacterium]
MIARVVAFRTLRNVSAEGAYANLELAKQLSKARLSPRDAAFATELVAGTCRAQGVYDQIIALAANRRLKDLQPAVVDVLRLASHQLLAMRVPTHAATDSMVDLAGKQVGGRVKGLVNAVCRRIGERTWEEWVADLTRDLDELGAMAVRTCHPRWIAAAFAERLPADEVEPALAADNAAPRPHLAAWPGLCAPADIPDCEPARFSPYGVYPQRPPGDYEQVRRGLAGVQDEGSQLVAAALARPAAADGPWLDMCAGPGGKAALLNALALAAGSWLLASELRPGRAALVAQALRAFPQRHVIAADGQCPPWPSGAFSRVLADVPCTGLGALRRRPDARWRRLESSVDELEPLQRGLLAQAVAAAKPGGVVAYVTCSPHLRETHQVVESVRDRVTPLRAADYLPGVPDCADGDYAQLWPHKHGTDAMFLALLRVTG